MRKVVTRQALVAVGAAAAWSSLLTTTPGPSVCGAFDARPLAYHPRRRASYNREVAGISQTGTSLCSELKDDGSTESSSSFVPEMKTYSARYLEDNGLTIITDNDGKVRIQAGNDLDPIERNEQGDSISSETDGVLVTRGETSAMELVSEQQQKEDDDDDAALLRTNQSTQQAGQIRPSVKEHPAKVVPQTGFNVVLTHCTADFDSLASAVGLAKLWSAQTEREVVDKGEYDSASDFPTFVVLPRGAHPSVQRFLALHKHLFPIRSLKSLPSDLSGLNRLGLVDAQTRDRIGPAEPLLDHANRITVVDHHIDNDSDIPEVQDYVLDKVGSVSTLIVERLMDAQLDEGLTEAEATLLALGIHADTGSLCYDSTTVRDAAALAWVMEMGASQAAIAEHAQSSLSSEQQNVLTQALINTNSTKVHGVTVSTVLLAADGFINGLAAVTQDALELSSSDVYLMGLVYEARSGGSRKGRKKQQESLKSRLLLDSEKAPPVVEESMYEAEGWKGGVEALLRERLMKAFQRQDTDNSGYLDQAEISAALAASGIIASDETLKNLVKAMDTNGDGKIDFEEFVSFAKDAQQMQKEDSTTKKPCTLIIIGRVKAGVNMKSVKLGKLLEKFGGGGHAKAASATVRLNDESEAAGILSGLVDELIETSLQEQPTVGDFMTAPVLSVKPDMTEVQVEDLFVRYDVRALPVVDENNNVIGLVTYKEVAAAKQRMFNKEQKRLRQMAKQAANGNGNGKSRSQQEQENRITEERRKRGSAVKGWMKQHIKTVEQSLTMAEVEAILLENDVGCIPVVADGTNQLIGMVTRTDLLRQHRYYPSLHYHNKGFSDSIAARKPIIELRKKLKKFDIEE